MAKIATLQPRVSMAQGNVNVAASHAWQDNRRASRHVRGYGTEWDKRRKRILARDRYICQCSECKGGALRLRPATEVDHIISKAEWLANHGTLDGCDDESNLQAINDDCHRTKTAEDRRRVYAAAPPARGGGSP